jgi:hypothetical protein
METQTTNPAGTLPAAACAGCVASFSVKALTFKTILAGLLPAASKDENRWILNTVHLELAGKGLSLVATDGRRLHCVQIQVETNNNGTRLATIPAGDVKALLSSPEFKAIKKKGDNRQTVVSFMESGQIEIGGHKLRTINKDGNFPLWRQVVPKDIVNHSALIPFPLARAGIEQREAALDTVGEKIMSQILPTLEQINATQGLGAFESWKKKIGQAIKSARKGFKDKNGSIGFQFRPNQIATFLPYSITSKDVPAGALPMSFDYQGQIQKKEDGAEAVFLNPQYMEDGAEAAESILSLFDVRPEGIMIKDGNSPVLINHGRLDMEQPFSLRFVIMPQRVF